MTRKNGALAVALSIVGAVALFASYPQPALAQIVSQPSPAHAKLAVRPRVIGIVLYPGFEVLDVFGPTEMWANIPDFKVVMIAQTKGPVRSAQGVTV